MSPIGSAQAPTRLLLVEDYFMVAEIYRSLLDELGYEVVGPAPSVEAALALLEEQEVDGAVLDVTLQGQPVTPVAKRLAELQLPFIFLTALMNLEFLPAHLCEAITVQKPATAGELEDALRRSGLEASGRYVPEGESVRKGSADRPPVSPEGIDPRSPAMR